MKTISFFLAVGVAILSASFLGSILSIVKISSVTANFIIYAFLGLVLIIMGFFLEGNKETLSSGFFVGGAILLLLSSMISGLKALTSSFSGILGKTATTVSLSTDMITYLNVLFLGIALTFFIISAVKIDKKE